MTATLPSRAWAMAALNCSSVLAGLLSNACGKVSGSSLAGSKTRAPPARANR